MSESNGTPATTEQIWLTPDSAIPFWTAVFVMITVMGAFLWWPVTLIGAIITVGLIVKWASNQRHETSELPKG